MIRVLLAVNDVRVAEHLGGLAAESDDMEVVATIRDPQELRGAFPRLEFDAVVMHDRRGALPLVEMTRELTVANPDLGLVLVVSEDSPDLLRSGMQAGARDVIAEPVGLEQLETSVAAAAAWTQALRRRASREADEIRGLGRVITVVGAKGGVGTTTIAIHLALAARELGQATACLIDLDLQAGDLRAFLDLPYRRSIADLVPVAGELTGRHLTETMYNHSSGLRVLLSPQEGEQAESVEAAATRNILTAIRTREDVTVIDAGSTLTEASAIAVEMADTVLVVTTPDVVSLRGVGRLCSMWERLRIEPTEVRVLLNRTSRRLEVQPELARRVVPVPLLSTTVPADFSALESAVNTGLATDQAGNAGLVQAMGAVLGEIAALPQGQEAGSADRAKSIVARFAGESGQVAIETVGLIPVLLVVLIALWQIVLIGMSFSYAGHAARVGARALAVGDPVVSAAQRDLPQAWRDKMNVVTASHDVKVGVQLPLLVPGLLNLPITISSSAGTVIEDQPLAADQATPGQTLPVGATNSLGLSGVSTPVVPGDKVIIEPNGVAAAPANAPPAVKQAIAAANQLIEKPYIYGGGHAGPLSQIAPGYDCSSATSFVLYLAGLHDVSPQDSTGLESWGVNGPGSWITVYANAGHAHITIAGANFDTWAGEGQPPNPPSTGPRWTYTMTDPGSFTERHPPGL